MCTGFLGIQTEKLSPCHNCAYPSTGSLIPHMSWVASFKGGFINLAYSLPLSHHCSGESQEVGRGFTVVGAGLYHRGGGLQVCFVGAMMGLSLSRPHEEGDIRNHKRPNSKQKMLPQGPMPHLHGPTPCFPPSAPPEYYQEVAQNSLFQNRHPYLTVVIPHEDRDYSFTHCFEVCILV